MIADIPNANGKVTDKNLGDPLVATAPDGLDRQAVLTQRLYSYGETRYYVDGVALGQQFKTEKSARAEVARRIGAGTMGALPLAPRQKAAGQTRVRALSGSDGIVQTAGAGKNTVVELAVREEMRKGRWQVTGYVATKISSYSIESFADSQARTKYGYPLASQTDNTLIRTSTGGAITELAQAHQRTRELVASRSLTKVSAAEAKELSDATRLPKKVVSAMNGSDRIKYLLQETLRQLPESAAGELKAMLTSPESLAVMGAFLVAGAVPFLSVPAMVVGALLLGNDALDTGGKMVDAVKSTLTASTQAELVNAGKDLAQALMHSAVIVASPVAGKRAGQAINTSWKASTSAEGVAANHFKRTVALRNKGQSTDKDVARAAGLLVQAKRATAAGSTPKSTPAARAAAARSAIEAQLKTKGTGERDPVNLTSSPQARLSAMKSALVERWQGSSGREPLLDGKSQRNLRKAIDSQLARIPGDLAKEQYLKNLAASGQTVARMAKGEPVAGNAVGKGKKQETVVSEVHAPAPELAFPSTLKSRLGASRSTWPV